MNQLLGTTLGVASGGVGVAAANGNYSAAFLGTITLLLIVLHMIRQRDEGKKL